MEEGYKLLNAYPKRTIGLSKLQEMFSERFSTYEEFSDYVLMLEENGVLQMVKSKGRNTRNPSLAYEYRIDKSRCMDDLHQELQYYRHQLHPAIHLDEYYRKDLQLWQHDLPYLLKIDEYIKAYGLPTETVPVPERSFELMQDEKWITEKGGKEILERVGLLSPIKNDPRFRSVDVCDPPENNSSSNAISLNCRKQDNVSRVTSCTTDDGILHFNLRLREKGHPQY